MLGTGILIFSYRPLPVDFVSHRQPQARLGNHSLRLLPVGDEICLPLQIQRSVELSRRFVLSIDPLMKAISLRDAAGQSGSVQAVFF